MTAAAHPGLTRSELCALIEISPPSLKGLVHGKVIRKRPRGTGNYLRFSIDDAVTAAIAKTLLNVGVTVATIRSLFAAVDKPKLPEAKPWVWLKSAERTREGAILCLVGEVPGLPSYVGTVCLTTKVGAQRVAAGKGQAILIDVGEVIAQIERRTGVSYSE